MVIDGFHLPGVETLTPAGLVFLLVLLFYFGKVVPISRVRDEQKTTEYWRDAAEKKQATIDKQTETIHILTEGVGKTVEKVMTAIQEKAGVEK